MKSFKDTVFFNKSDELVHVNNTDALVRIEGEEIVIEAKIPPVDALCGCDKAAIRIEAIRNLFNFSRK